MLRRSFLAVLGLGVALLGFSTDANARWRVAESEHFIVYADDSERDLQRFGEMLERYHAGLEFVTGRRMDPPSPSNRLTVFVVGDQRDIAELQGTTSRAIAGFYIPRASGSMAFVQDVRVSTGDIDFSMIVLLHEYAHHFFAITSPYPLPSWMSEGSAEYFASARFPRSGDLEFGRAAHHRSGELWYAENVPIRQLLEYRNRASGSGGDAFYGRSWLLYHYLMMSEDRAGQLNGYLRALASGMTPLEAGEEVFGDLDELESDLDGYMRLRRTNFFRLSAAAITISPVSVRDLSEGMGEVLPLMIRSKRGVSREEAQELLPEIREVAAEYPDDAGVLAALAEAEFDAGNDAEAIAAADQAIAIDPSVPNAYVQKGYALFRMAGESGDADDFTAAMAPFQALNQIESDHPLPLIHFYRSFMERGEEPTELARHALERSLQLAPFDTSLRLQVVQMLAREGKIAIARNALLPLLANPHNAGLVQLAQRMDADLDGAEEGTPRYLLATFQIIEKPASAGEEEDSEEDGAE